MEAASQSDSKPPRRLKGEGRTLISAIWFWRAAVTALFWVSWSERSPTRLQSFETDSSDMVGRVDGIRRATKGTCIEVRGLDGRVSQEGYRGSTFGESRDDGAARPNFHSQKLVLSRHNDSTTLGRHARIRSHLVDTWKH